MPLLSGTSLLQRLKQLLQECDSVDIAVAWARECLAIQELRSFAQGGGKLRCAVGLASNFTDPDTLADLQKIGKLRIGQSPQSSFGIFHPKCYCFRSESETTVWVGSANLTRGGFGNNFELVHEFTAPPGPLQWFVSLWRSLDRDPTKAIRRYRDRYKPPPTPKSRKHHGTYQRNRKRLAGRLRQDWTWADFVENLWLKHDAFIERDNGWSVLGDYNSYLHTISFGWRVTRLRSWTNLPDWQSHVLYGAPPWGPLGDMRVAGTAVRMFTSAAAQAKSDRAEIRQHLKSAIATRDDIIRIGVNAMANIKRPGVSHGVATRLLALARPDAYVSLNNPSAQGLASFSGLRPTTLPQQYRKLLESVHASAWYRAPAPEDTFEKEIWTYRAALVDAFVYQPR